MMCSDVVLDSETPQSYRLKFDRSKGGWSLSELISSRIRRDVNAALFPKPLDDERCSARFTGDQGVIN
jgi:hypothetical protein